MRWSLPFNPLENAEQRAYLEAEDSGFQFSHSFTEQIGGQLAAGFTLTGLYEDTLSSGPLAEKNIPAFLATRAVK
ncbi:hypothetical protein [Alloscardovia macacae]|uniref:Type 11 methyltransferase n=1 Tax=Alloscardovia macacae TaxID=1160091 RepID=A0A261F773_9BIFI|nr:hypothetical protein [Alloscardovia macacae]OZG54999.1 type 11 methyltransferase [Alloscardovia macacae]